MIELLSYLLLGLLFVRGYFIYATFMDSNITKNDKFIIWTFITFVLSAIPLLLLKYQFPEMNGLLKLDTFQSFVFVLNDITVLLMINIIVQKLIHCARKEKDQNDYIYVIALLVGTCVVIFLRDAMISLPAYFNDFTLTLKSFLFISYLIYIIIIVSSTFIGTKLKNNNNHFILSYVNYLFMILACSYFFVSYVGLPGITGECDSAYQHCFFFHSSFILMSGLASIIQYKYISGTINKENMYNQVMSMVKIITSITALAFLIKFISFKILGYDAIPMVDYIYMVSAISISVAGLKSTSLSKFIDLKDIVKK